MFADDIPRTESASHEAAKSNAKASNLNTLHIFMFPSGAAKIGNRVKGMALGDGRDRQAVIGNEQLAVSLSGFALSAI